MRTSIWAFWPRTLLGFILVVRSECLQRIPHFLNEGILDVPGVLFGGLGKLIQQHSLFVRLFLLDSSFFEGLGLGDLLVHHGGFCLLFHQRLLEFGYTVAWLVGGLGIRHDYLRRVESAILHESLLPLEPGWGSSRTCRLIQLSNGLLFFG